MSDLHELNDLRPAPRAASPLVIWILCGVAIGGAWMLRDSSSQMASVPVASVNSTTDAHAPTPAAVVTAKRASLTATASQ